MNNNQTYNIICLSNQQWDFPFPTNKKHVMSRLANMGNNVLFVDPPINTGRLFLRQILRKQWSPKRIFTQTYKDENATIYSPLKPIPNPQLTVKWHVDKINKLAEKLFDPNKKTILWIYHVETQELEYILDNVKYDVLIYDCVDNYSAFPENSTFYSTTVGKKKIIEQEKMLTQRADVVFATAPGLVDKLKKYREEVFYTPNVGDYEKFKNVQNLKDQIPEDLAQISRPRIAFTGSVDEYKFDRELVLKIAKDHPNYSFVIIGPIALKDREATAEELGFADYSNIKYMGSRPFKTIEKYYAGFDVFIIPYQLNDYTVGGCFPIKFHDALAAGLSTVVTNLPAYAPFRDVCYISKNYDEFSINIEKALREDSSEKIKARQLVAKDNSWEGKIEKMLGFIDTKVTNKTELLENS